MFQAAAEPIARQTRAGIRGNVRPGFFLDKALRRLTRAPNWILGRHERDQRALVGVGGERSPEKIPRRLPRRPALGIQGVMARSSGGDGLVSARQDTIADGV